MGTERMREFEIQIKIKNNLLKQRREELGQTQADLARSAEISYIGYNELECLRASPLRSDGEWRGIAKKIAKFYGAQPEELWPEVVRAVQISSITSKISGPDLLLLSSECQQRAALPADASMDAQEFKDAMAQGLGRLTPRQERVIRKHFGLDGDDPMSFADIAREWGLSRSRIGGLFAMAMRRRPAAQ